MIDGAIDRFRVSFLAFSVPLLGSGCLYMTQTCPSLSDGGSAAHGNCMLLYNIPINTH